MTTRWKFINEINGIVVAVLKYLETNTLI